MRSLWVAMPDSLVPYLDTSARTNMVDRVGSGITTTNTLSGQSHIDTLTADYLKVQLSEASTLEIKRWKGSQGDSVLAVVSTVYGPEPESKLDFYDTSWHLLAAHVEAEAAPMMRPDTMTEERFETLQLMIDPMMRAYQLSPDNATLTVRYSLPMLSKAEKSEVEAILQEKKVRFGCLIVK